MTDGPVKGDTGELPANDLASQSLPSEVVRSIITPLEYVLAFESRVKEFYAFMADKEAEIASLKLALEKAREENRNLANRVNILQYNHKSWQEQLATVGAVVSKPFNRQEGG